jgi:amino acid adenylation domain-containing protein
LAHELLRTTARRLPGKPAVVCTEESHTFAEIDRQSDAMAAALAHDGVGRGDRVAIFLENSAELVISVFGVLKAGAVAVMVNQSTKARKLAYIMNDCGARTLIAQPSVEPIIAKAAPQIPSFSQVFWTSAPAGESVPGRTWAAIVQEPSPAPPDPVLIDQDLCMILYTSGTTGTPKGVMLTHLNVISATRSIAMYLENTEEDRICCVLPLTFSYGLYQMYCMALVGYTLILEKSFAYPVDVLRRMEKHRVTGFPGVPGMFATILQVVPRAGIDLSSLRYVTNAAGPLSATHIQEVLQLLPKTRFFSMHGQTECARTCYLEGERLLQKPGSIGKAMPNTELYVVDQENRRVGPGVVGELVVRGPNVMRGYWNMPEATAAKLREGPIPGEKVLYTGDLFRTDEDGDLYFVSRMDDIIKCKGEKVSPKEVEDVLYMIDAVAEAAVVGVNDPIDGQAVKAFVVLREGASVTDREIRQHCRLNLENYMVPRFIEIRDSLPKTGSGKICRRELVAPEMG